MRKGYIFALGLGVTLGLVAASLFSKYYLHKPRDMIEVNTLYVSQDENIRTKSEKSESEGLADLIDAAMTSELEDQWLFSVCDETWYEIGQVSYLKENTLSSRINFADWEDIVMSCDQIKGVHLHPRYNSPYEADYVIAAMPSPKDLSATVFSEEDFREIHTTGTYVSGVVSEAGLIEYDITEEGYEYLSEKNRESILDYTTQVITDSIICSIKDIKSTYDEEIENWCGCLNMSPHFVCDYTPAYEILSE